MNLRWNLDSLYTSFESEQYKNDFKRLKEEIAEICAWSEENLTVQNHDGAAEKIEWYINKRNAFSRFFLLYSFASLTRSVESDNETATKYIDLISNEFTNLTKPVTQFEKFVGRLDNLDAIIEQSDVCKQHAFYLTEIRDNAKYVMSEEAEITTAKLKTTGSSAWSAMKEQLTSTLMIDVMIKGEMKTLPLAAVRNLAHDADAQTRKAAFEAELKAYEQVDKAVAFALNSVKGEVLTESKMRGYESPLEMTLKNSRMERKTLDALIGSIEEHLPTLRRFYKKKAEVLGHKGALPYYDLFAPVGSVDMRFTFEEAAAFVVKNFNAFSKKLGDFAQKAFDNNWIDAEPRKGKRGGAFCSNLHPIKESRIMSNFSGSFSDMSTLAHELGHGYHGECLQNVTYLNSHYTMPIAETASTFCETLVCNAAIKSASKEEAFVILENEITDMTQVIVDIYARYVFETNLFAERKNGPLSVNEINALMVDAQKKAYGDALDFDRPHPYMWINKPHYYYAGSNFYNFPYAYGLMFALGLYSEFLQTGEAFAPKYDALLAATGQATLEEIGQKAGIDVSDKAFWASSLKQVVKKIDEFCAY